MRSSDSLFRLIKAMSKGDRRNFKLFARLQEGDKKYIRLFDAIDKQGKYDEEKLLKQFKGERFTRQFSVAKNYLYNYILKTLHIFHRGPHAELSVWLHQIQILMGKNLFEQAHKLIRKAKHLAERQERFQELMYLLDYERKIYQHRQKTREYAIFITEIQAKERETLRKMHNLLDYVQLYDDVHQLLTKAQTARVEDEVRELAALTRHPLLASEDCALSIRAKLKMFQVLSGLHRYQYQREDALKYYLKTIETYDAHSEIKKEDNFLYIKNLSNVGMYYYLLGEMGQAKAYLEKLRNAKVNNEQEARRVFEKYYQFRVGLCIEQGLAVEGREVVEDFVQELGRIEGKIMKSTELGIYYGIGYFFISIGDPNQALHWINRLLNEPKTELRTDLQCMMRLLNLIVHYQLGNRDLMDSLIKSATRFISNRNRLYKYERTVLKYMRLLAHIHPDADPADTLREFKHELIEVQKDDFEAKAMRLFKILDWIDGQLTGRTMAEIFRDSISKTLSAKKPD